MTNYFERTRAKFGAPPRKFSILERIDNYQTQPKWMRDEDGLACVYRDRKTLLVQGDIVPAHIIQANVGIYSPGNDDLPAVVVFSFDPFYEQHINDLGTIADELYDYKGEQVADLELSQFVEAITDEHQVIFNAKIPGALTGDRAVYYTTIMVHREYLPVNYLKTQWFPLLVKPDAVESAIILPAKYWDAELVNAWNTDD